MRLRHLHGKIAIFADTFLTVEISARENPSCSSAPVEIFGFSQFLANLVKFNQIRLNSIKISKKIGPRSAKNPKISGLSKILDEIEIVKPATSWPIEMNKMRMHYWHVHVVVLT